MEKTLKGKRKDITMNKVVSFRLEDDLFNLINKYQQQFDAKNIGQTIRFLLEENKKNDSNIDLQFRKFYMLNQINLTIEKLISKNKNIEVLNKLDLIIQLLETELK